jgi:hypothetical protein
MGRKHDADVASPGFDVGRCIVMQFQIPGYLSCLVDSHQDAQINRFQICYMPCSNGFFVFLFFLNALYPCNLTVIKRTAFTSVFVACRFESNALPAW